MIIMKKIYFTLIALLASINMFAQGWPANYSGVMLQGFSWDSYDYSQWSVLEKQADDMKGFIDLVWLPQSGKCIETTKVMGYKPYYYFNQNSSFGTEAELRSLIAKFKANGIGGNSRCCGQPPQYRRLVHLPCRDIQWSDLPDVVYRYLQE